MVSLFSELSPCGFQILAFPCNQFGSQEPGTNAEIKKFAESQVATFSVTSTLPLPSRESVSYFDLEFSDL